MTKTLLMNLSFLDQYSCANGWARYAVGTSAFCNAIGEETPTALCVARVVALSAKRSPDKKTEHREAR